MVAMENKTVCVCVCVLGDCVFVQLCIQRVLWVDISSHFHYVYGNWLLSHIITSAHVCVYVYVCVCVSVCMCLCEGEREGGRGESVLSLQVSCVFGVGAVPPGQPARMTTMFS